VFTTLLEQQHGFYSTSNGVGKETVYWYKCTSKDNHGDGFSVASNSKSIGTDLVSSGDLRSAYVLGSANNADVVFKGCTSADNKVDIETTGSGNDVKILNCSCTLIQVLVFDSTTVLIDNFTSSFTGNYALNVVGHSITDDIDITVINSDFSSSLECKLQNTTRFTMRDSKSPSFVITPITASLPESSLPKITYTFDNVEFVSFFEREHSAYLLHPTTNGVARYVVDKPTNTVDWYVTDCTFPEIKPGNQGWPIRIWGGDLHVYGNVYANPELANLVGSGTLAALYEGDTLIIENTTIPAIDVSPPGVATGAADDDGRGNGIFESSFRNWL